MVDEILDSGIAEMLDAEFQHQEPPLRIEAGIRLMSDNEIVKYSSTVSIYHSMNYETDIVV